MQFMGGFPCGGLALHGSLPGKGTMNVSIVVQARFSCDTLDRGRRLTVSTGDHGILKWKAHKRHPRYSEPLVLWDRDASQKPRRVVLASVQVVGLQVSSTRMLLSSI